MPDEHLRCLSFHSVKGGVGKSTLSWLAATTLARKRPTLLVDMDLTGTSLADVFRLRAPRLAEESGGLRLNRSAADFLSPQESLGRIERRGQEADPRRKHVPFLNDDFLHEIGRFDETKDVTPNALGWTVETSDAEISQNLRVIPSSALPNDLNRILPIIYDELYAGFLEARLEWFLSRVLEHSNVRDVVFDSPPTIPGLSSALLSMAMRLPARKGLTPLGWTDTPSKLRAASTSWLPVLVTTPDLQDLRAADRWLVGRDEQELRQMHVVVNRARSENTAATAFNLRDRLAEAQYEDLDLDLSSGPIHPSVYPYEGVILRDDRIATNLLSIAETEELRLFGRGTVEVAQEHGLLRLIGALEDGHAP